jgi:hypothetical protein
MRISEIFEQPIDWHWGMQLADYADAHFQIDDIEYTVYFSQNALNQEDKFYIEFVATDSEGNGEYGVTGRGNSIAVFATVIAIIHAFKEMHPDAPIVFTAEEPSRQKLYTRIVKRLSTRFQVTIGNSTAGHVEYTLK